MSRSPSPLPPEVHALLEWESEIPPLPARVRKRALDRARAALEMDQATPFAASGSVPRIRFALAVVVAVATAAAAGALGYSLGGSYVRSVPASEAATPVVLPARSPYTSDSPTLVVPSQMAGDAGPVQRPSQAEPEPEELLLLGEARSAVADHDFAAALVPISEHARRFESGLLTEEREALRVTALSGLGRTVEARHAANAFAREFPHSVLLGAVRRMAASKQ